MEKLYFSKAASCAETRKLLHILLRDELGVEQRGRVKGHILSCEPCALVFGDAIAASMGHGLLTADASFPMPTPPRPVLEAIGQPHITEEGRKALQTALLLWTVGAVAALRLRTKGVLGSLSKAVWPEQVNVKVVDSTSQHPERIIPFAVVTPPTVTKNGHFLLTLHTNERGLVGGKLLCRVETIEGMQVTFAGELQHAVENQGSQIMINVDGLPACDKDVIIPADRVQLSLLGSSHNAS